MRKLMVAVAVACGVFFTLSTPAEAAWKIRLSTDGGANFGTAVADGDAGDSSAIVGVIRIFVAGVSVEASTTHSLTLKSTTMDLAVSGQAAANTTYNLVVQSSLSDIPTGPPPQDLEYAFTGSLKPGTLSATMSSYIDDNNQLFVSSGFDVVASSPIVNVPPGGSGNIGFTASANYSLTSEVTLTGTTNGNQVSVSLDNNNLITAAPAPSGLMLAFAALPIIVFGAWLRRRPIVAPAL